MNAQHTPGPWNCFSDGRIFAAKHGDVENIPFVGEAFVGYSTIPSDVARANAKLMAAAPELLAAAQRAAHIMAELPDQTPQVIAARQMLVDSIKAAAPAYYGGAA